MKSPITFLMILFSSSAFAQERCFDLFVPGFTHAAFEIAKLEHALNTDLIYVNHPERRKMQLSHLNSQKLELAKKFSTDVSTRDLIREYNIVYADLTKGAKGEIFKRDQIAIQRTIKIKTEANETRKQGIIEHVRSVHSDTKKLKELYAEWIDEGLKENFELVMDANIGEQTLSAMISAFADSKTAAWTDIYRKFIESPNKDLLAQFTREVLSKPHAKDMTDLILLALENADFRTIAFLAADVFSKPHVKDITNLIKLWIEKADPQEQSYLAMHVFSQPHMADMEDLVLLSLAKANPGALRVFATYTFSQPHTSPMTKSLRILIEKMDQMVESDLIIHTFSKIHAQNWIPELALFIKKLGRSASVSSLQKWVFDQTWAQTPAHQILRESLNEKYNVQQRAHYIDEGLTKLNLTSGTTP